MRTHTTRRSRAIRSGGALTFAAAGLLVLAACGPSGGTAAASPASSSGTTVTVRDSGGMHVLATSSGLTLYVSDQEKGKALCTSGACHAIWAPLTVTGGQKPTASGAVADELTTMTLADGTRQVAYDGQPLYTFSFDHSSGQLNGDGQTDSFDGTDFTWHAATTGSDSTPRSGAASGSSDGYGHGY